MFIGHYGPAYAIKRWRPRLPIFVLFLAVQLIDVAWAILVPLGVEKVRIVPGITKTNPLDLYYMPYTHSLPAALLWALTFGAVYAGLRSRERPVRIGIAAFAAVFSHWILDLLVHRPDLPLLGNRMKVGVGLWDYPVLALGLEVALLVGGLLLYLSTTRARDALGRFGPWVFVALLCGMQVTMFFGRPPETANQAAVAALVSYVAFALVAAWLDRHREEAPNPRATDASALASRSLEARPR